MKSHDMHAITDELSGVALDTVREIRRDKTLIPIILGALCITSIIFFFVAVLPVIKVAESFVQIASGASGQVTGVAVGTVEGIIQGVPSGYADGAEAGLSAEDTAVVIANSIETDLKSLGRLQVLAANIDLTTDHEEGKKYQALYLLRGQYVFTIDMNKADITYEGGQITIVLPQPEIESSINHSETELLAEWERKYFNGSTIEGFKAYLNSILQIEAASLEKINVLSKQASEFAREQVLAIANAVRGDHSVKINVIFQPAGGDELERK